MDQNEKFNSLVLQKLDAIVEKVDDLDEKVDRLEGRMDRLEGRMDRLEDRMDCLEQKVDQLSEQNRKAHRELASMDEAILDEVERVHGILERHMNDPEAHQKICRA